MLKLINMVNMIKNTITATKAKTEFGALVDQARKHPVTITRNSRPVAVILSPEEFQRFSEIEDRFWGDKAKKVDAKSDFLSPKQSLDFLRS